MLVLSYLAHADLTHGQIVESQIAIAIEDLRQVRSGMSECDLLLTAVLCLL